MSTPFSAYKDQHELIEALEKKSKTVSEFIYRTIVVFTLFYNALSILSFCIAKKLSRRKKHNPGVTAKEVHLLVVV